MMCTLYIYIYIRLASIIWIDIDGDQCQSSDVSSYDDCYTCFLFCFVLFLIQFQFLSSFTHDHDLSQSILNAHPFSSYLK